jgi:hypothetical protein
MRDSLIKRLSNKHLGRLGRVKQIFLLDRRAGMGCLSSSGPNESRTSETLARPDGTALRKPSNASCKARLAARPSPDR